MWVQRGFVTSARLVRMADGIPQLTLIAASQRGCFTRDQWRGCGLSDRQLDVAAREGWVMSVHQRVWRVAGMPPSWQQRVRAATLLSPGAVFAGGRTALALHGLCESHDPRPHVTIDHGLRFRFDRREVVVHTSRTLRFDTPTEVDGTPAVSVERAIFEDGSRAADRPWFDRMSEAGRRGLVTIGSLAETLEIMGPIPRVRLMRQALHRLDDRMVDANSVPEITLLKLVEEVTGREAVLNHPVAGPGNVFVHRVDVAVVEFKFGVENDSVRWHGAGSRQDTDRERDHDYRTVGWVVPRVMSSWLRHDIPKARAVVRTGWEDALQRHSR